MTDAGNIYSPSDIIGLIHLLEHVLFYNLSKYPEYNYLQKFIDLNSGFVNTFITSEVIHNEDAFIDELADTSFPN